MLKWLFLILSAGLVALGAPPATVSFRAHLKGGDPISGRCQIRVWVDQEAVISVSGDLVTVQSVSAKRPRDAGSECSTAMPKQLNAFNFRGIEGRGEVKLLKDAKANKGTAVISIKDSRSGEQRYAFELVWFGTGGWGNGGYSPGRWRSPRMTASMVRDCESAARKQILLRHKISVVAMRRLDGDRAEGRENWIVGDATGELDGAKPNLSIACRLDLSSGRVLQVDTKLLPADAPKWKPKAKSKWTPKPKQTN